MELGEKNIKSILFIALVSITFYTALQNLEAVVNFVGWIFGLLAPFMIGAAIAFILNIPMKMMESKLFSSSNNRTIQKFKRPISLLLSILLVISIIFFVAFLVIPEIVSTFSIIKDSAPSFLEKVQKWAEQLPQSKEWIDYLQLNWEKIASSVANSVKTGTSTLLGSVMTAVTLIFNGTFTLIVGFIFAIYILSSKEKLTRQFKKMLYAYLPENAAHRVTYISKMFHRTFHSFVTIQFTEAIILGVLCFIGMLIFRFPHAATVSVLIGFTALIPLIGAFIGAAAGVFMILMTAPARVLWFILFIIILQQIEGNLIYPKVVGGSIGLPPIWVFVAVFLGGSLLGALGMIVFVPLCSVMYNLVKESVNERLSNDTIKE